MRPHPPFCYSEAMNEGQPDKTDQSIKVDQPGLYRIKIQGRLDPNGPNRFEGMNLVVETNAAGIPFTILTGPISDQAALHGLVARIRDLGLPLVSLELVKALN